MVLRRGPVLDRPLRVSSDGGPASRTSPRPSPEGQSRVTRRRGRETSLMFRSTRVFTDSLVDLRPGTPFSSPPFLLLRSPPPTPPRHSARIQSPPVSGGGEGRVQTPLSLPVPLTHGPRRRNVISSQNLKLTSYIQTPDPT